MKVVMTCLFVFVLVMSGFQLTGQLNVISYNIRYDNPGDGEHAWPNRKDNVINLLKFHEADIFCLQEVLHTQVVQLDKAFPYFSYVGVGRDDGIRKGEYAPVFFNTERFTKIESGHFWLSDNPGIPGLGWDAACIRICTWIVLKESDTGKQFMVFNTHFDHIGLKARENAADLIIREIDNKSDGMPVILCGDFNLPPESVPMKKLASALHDSYTKTELPPHGATGTWSGFTYNDEAGDRIDYIFVSEGVRVLRYAALTDSRDRSFFSDHLPVFVEVGF